ncbi:MAG: matrixin family metalloprotease [Oenococcus sp.]|uniref:matrixin family metalloprotease n=1 Tax=Oenococcus TaxID=46254 RepID=UPI0021E80C5F|nr:matrixin family metalloprotease [Oenococcus kitaharae]MCV3295896.1 matrixin family metalloprotease [Oenococcus kitaharae]
MRHKLTIILFAGLAAGTFLVHQNYITLPGNGNQVVRQSTDSIASQLNDSWKRLTLALGQKGQGFNLPSLPTIDSGSTGQASGQNSANTEVPTDPNATPVESIVAGVPLSNVYYYRFQPGLPQAAQQLFQRAVNIYNATGIVRLIPGNATGTQNSVVFADYWKDDGPVSQLGTIELGRGGPQIIQRYGIANTAYNHGMASLNMSYQQSLSLSVAVHELGHALGLGHSSSRDSVMYPIDQGKSQLSPGDLAGLRAIYTRS